MPGSNRRILISAIIGALLLLLCGSCACRSAWFRRCDPPVAVAPQVIEYSVQWVDEPAPWRLCYRYAASEPWAQVSGSPDFETREAAEQALLEALR